MLRRLGRAARQGVDACRSGGVAEPPDQVDSDTSAPYQSPLASNRCTSTVRLEFAEGRTRAEVHHSAESAAPGHARERRIHLPAEEVFRADGNSMFIVG